MNYKVIRHAKDLTSCFKYDDEVRFVSDTLVYVTVYKFYTN